MSGDTKYYIHVTEHFPVIKGNKLLMPTTLCTNLQNIMLSEESQREMVSYYMKCAEQDSRQGQKAD